jgi:hypothetical protein
MMKLFLLIALLPLTAYAQNFPTDTIQYSTQASAPAASHTGTVFTYYGSDGFPYWANSSHSIFGYMYSAGNYPTGAVLTGQGTRNPASATASSESVFLGHVSGQPTFGLIANTHVSPTAAIQYSKLNLVGSILATDLAGSIPYSKLILTGSILNADLAGSIAPNKFSAQTASRAAAFDASGFLAPALTTFTELNYVNGVTSGIQAQLDSMVAKAGTQTVTGDKTFTGKTVQSLPSIPDATVTTTGNIDALDTSAGSSFRFTGAAPVLRGIANGADGRYIVLINAAGTTISVKNEHASATAANRIITGTAADLTLADTASLLAKYDATSSRWRIVGGSGGGGGSSSLSALTKDYTITAHGFAVGDVIYCTATTTCAKAKADADSTSEALGVVTAVPTANTFTLTQIGYATGLSGLLANSTYYLSASSTGALTLNEPTTVGQISKPMFFADSTTTGYVLNMRGQFVTAAVSSAVKVQSVSFGGASAISLCTSSPCTIYQSTTGISSVTNNLSGVYTINFVGGTWSTTPRCVWNSISNDIRFAINKSGSTSSVAITSYNTSVATANSAYDVICTE